MRLTKAPSDFVVLADVRARKSNQACPLVSWSLYATNERDGLFWSAHSHNSVNVIYADTHVAATQLTTLKGLLSNYIQLAYGKL